MVGLFRIGTLSTRPRRNSVGVGSAARSAQCDGGLAGDPRAGHSRPSDPGLQNTVLARRETEIPKGRRGLMRMGTGSVMAQSSSAWISGRKGTASVCPTGRPWVGAPRSRERRYLVPLVRSYIPLCDSSQSLCQVPSPILLREYAKSVVIVQLQTQRTEQRVKDIGIGFYARRGRYTATVPLLRSPIPFRAYNLIRIWASCAVRLSGALETLSNMARVTLSIQPADSLSHSCCLRSPTGTFTVIWPWLGCVISLSVSVKRASVLMGGNESARTRGPSIGPFLSRGSGRVAAAVASPVAGALSSAIVVRGRGRVTVSWSCRRLYTVSGRRGCRARTVVQFRGSRVEWRSLIR